MLNVREIPDDVKWQLAARCAASLPAIYDAAFRTAAGDQYEACEQECWMEVSRLVCDVVRELALPVKNAREIATSLHTVMTVLFGPDFKPETLELSDDGAVILIKRCPFLTHGHTPGMPTERFFPRCMALILTAVPLLNNTYTARYVRTMCMGDRQCEIKIEVGKPVVDKKPARKKA
ncbi:MAG: hypothetical protein NTZ39_01315 [Methanoregula sp.]|nr:hypothetical protein [Methanoregula sp.]